MNVLIPRPDWLTPESLLQLLSLAQNAKLRREFGNCLAELAGERWQNPSKDDPAWGEALAALLSSHQGFQLFHRAAERYNGGKLGSDHRLNLQRRVFDRVNAAWRSASLPPQPASESDMVGPLIRAGLIEEASLLVWLLWLTTTDNADISILVRSEPLLAKQFNLLLAAEGVDPLVEVRRLASMVAEAASFDPDVLDALGRIAGEAAERLRADLAQDKVRRAALQARLGGSPLRLGTAVIPQRMSLDHIHNVLDAAEAAAAAVEQLAQELEAATAQRAFGKAASIGQKADSAEQVASNKKAELLALLTEVPAQSLLTTPEAEVNIETVTEILSGAIEAEPPDTGERPDHHGSVVAATLPIKPADANPDTLVKATMAEVVDEITAPATIIGNAAPRLVAGQVEDPGPLLGSPPISDQAAKLPHEPHAFSAPMNVVVARPAETAFFNALSEERLGLAAALFDAGALGEDAIAARRSVNLAALALVADGSGVVDDRVGTEAEALIEACSIHSPADAVVSVIWQLALPAACLLMVLAPGGNTARLVDNLLAQPAIPPQLNSLARALLESSAALGGLWKSSGVLASLASEDERRTALNNHCTKIRSWLERNRDAALNNYAPAKILWSRMLAEDSTLGAMIAAAVANLTRRAPEVATALVSFSGENEWRQLDIKIRGLKLVQKTPISFGAERDLNDLLEEVQLLLREWTQLAAWTTRRHSGAKDVQRLRTSLLDLLAGTGRELDAQPRSPAVPLARKLLARFTALLKTGIAEPAAPSADQLLARDVIAVPGVSLSPAWRMQVHKDPATLDALVGAANESVTIEEAVARRVAAREFAEAVLALGLENDLEVRMNLDQNIRNAAGEAVSETKAGLTWLRSDTEAAEASGRLPFEEAQPFLEDIQAIHDSLGQSPPADVPALTAASTTLIENIKAALRTAESRVRERIAARLNRLDLARAIDVRDVVQRALNQGWLAIAEDLVDRAEAGEPIEDAGESPALPTEFDGFYPGRSEVLAQWLGSSKAGIGEYIARPDSLPPMIRKADGLASPERALPLARAWVACGKPGDPGLVRTMSDLFTALGFTDPRPESLPPLDPTAAEARFTLRAAPLSDRETTLLPDFGSAANGSYNVVCLWGQPDTTSLRSALQKPGNRSERVIVLFFGMLTNADRRELAKMARSGGITSVVVLDHVLALHLALTPQNRLRTFFACALPFSGVKPWSETGAPPPEMFFGRHDERLSIEATSGQQSHLVYGGRQLGKTALLRQVERGAAGDAQRVVRYVDIKRFGNTAPTQELWVTLADALSPDIKITLSSQADLAARFEREVRAWLDAKPERSILLLLDESDKFFKEEQTQRYQITERLRALSEATGRRFKPVFAGLENVQRLARDPNNPIAQLATPLLIGPLLRGAERRAAEALVRWPFAALGFTLPSEAVNRILIFANYYPSLIQLVCQNLLHALRGKSRNGPPWQVEIIDVEQLLASAELRRAAFEKFRITLELDQRYFLLALVVAALSQNNSNALEVGIEIRELHSYAAICWPAGFQPDLGEAAFEALADQMVGLGLLRSASGHCYALRSANLIHLIGSPKGIADQLAAFLHRPAPPEPDPLEDRRTVSGFPSLLTTRQEDEIIGSAPCHRIVICLGLCLGGTRPGGTTRIEEAVREAARAARGRGAQIEIPSLKARSLEAFIAEIKNLAVRKEPGHRVLIVSPAHGWTSEWVAAAHEAITERPVGSVKLRFVFLADARLGWAWTEDSPRRDALLSMMVGGVRLGVEMVPGLWNRPSLDVWRELTEPTGLADWLVNDPDVLLRGTGGWDWALRLLRAPGHNRIAKIDAVGLAEQLLTRAPTGDDDPFSDLREMPDAVRLLTAVAEAETLRTGTEKVDAALIAEAGGFTMPPRGLVWAEAIEAVTRGRNGLQLNPLLRAALPMLQASLK